MIELKFMETAISEAQKAFLQGEIPVGCVIVKNGKIIARTHNTTQKNKNSVCHAEMNAIMQAIEVTGEKDLRDCDVYVTLEPCPMCAGAFINLKVKRLFIGAPEPKSGCFGSVSDFNMLNFNHKIEVYYGICEDSCKKLMTDFFKSKRQKTPNV